MNKDSEEKKEEALKFLLENETGVLATASKQGQPSARLVYYTADDDFNTFFITLKDTRKVAHIEANSLGAFVISDTGMPRTLQMEGELIDLSDTATIDPLLTGFVRRLMSHKKYGIPISHFDASALKFYKLKPTWIRFGDFTFGEGTDAVLTQIT